MSTETDIESIEQALEQCATCTKAMLPTLVLTEDFKKDNMPLLKSGKMTQKEYDDKYSQRFDAMISKGSLYFCQNCDNILYKKD